MVVLIAMTLAPLLLQGHRRSDFGIYYVWGYAMRHGVNPYTTDLGPLAASLGIDLGGFRHANYPALFILLFEPLTLLMPNGANLIWLGLNLALLFFSLELLLGRLPSGGRPCSRVLWALALLYQPVSSNFYLGQTQVLLLFLLIAALRCSEKGRDLAAGSLIGLAGLLKVFPLAALGVFVLGRRWRVVISAMGVIFTGLSLTAVILGVRPTLGFVHTLGSVVDRRRIEFEDGRLISLNAFITRLLLSKHIAATGFFADRATQRLVVAGVSVVAVALSTLATWNVRSARELSAGFALWVVTAILVSPTAWHHYELLLLIPFALALGDWPHAGNARAAAALALASYVLTQATWVWSPFAGSHPGGWLAVVFKEGFFFSLVVGYIAALMLVRSPGRALVMAAAPVGASEPAR